MRKRLVTWTVLTSSLVGFGVWALLGPPQHGASAPLPRNFAAKLH
jgi:hypothetical protein